MGSQIVVLHEVCAHVSDLSAFQLVDGVVIFALILGIYGNSVLVLVVKFINEVSQCLSVDTAHGMPELNRGSGKLGVIHSCEAGHAKDHGCGQGSCQYGKNFSSHFEFPP